MDTDKPVEPPEEGWFERMCRETQEALDRVAPAPQAPLRLVSERKER